MSLEFLAVTPLVSGARAGVGTEQPRLSQRLLLSLGVKAQPPAGRPRAGEPQSWERIDTMQTRQKLLPCSAGRLGRITAVAELSCAKKCGKKILLRSDDVNVLNAEKGSTPNLLRPQIHHPDLKNEILFYATGVFQAWFELE